MVESKRGKRLNIPGIKNLHTLRQSVQAWDNKVLTSEYYAIAQMTNAGLREGVFGERTYMGRADVDDQESRDHREMLGLYHQHGYRASILLCPERHLDNSVRARYAEISKPPTERYDLSKTPLQDLELWFRPYQRFTQTSRKALLVLEELRAWDLKGKGIENFCLIGFIGCWGLCGNSFRHTFPICE